MLFKMDNKGAVDLINNWTVGGQTAIFSTWLDWRRFTSNRIYSSQWEWCRLLRKNLPAYIQETCTNVL